jgi:hypothetical protein
MAQRAAGGELADPLARRGPAFPAARQRLSTLILAAENAARAWRWLSGPYCFFPKSVAFCPTRMMAILVMASPLASVPTTFMSARTVPSATYFLS